MTYLRHVLDHLRKDLRLEWRSRDSINGMLFFALLVVVVFGLAFDPTSYPTMTRQISGGILWVALLFASITAVMVAGTAKQRSRSTADGPFPCLCVIPCQSFGQPALRAYCRSSSRSNLYRVL
jgi:hypothetical protein